MSGRSALRVCLVVLTVLSLVVAAYGVIVIDNPQPPTAALIGKLVTAQANLISGYGCKKGGTFVVHASSVRVSQSNPTWAIARYEPARTNASDLCMTAGWVIVRDQGHGWQLVEARIGNQCGMSGIPGDVKRDFRCA